MKGRGIMPGEPKRNPRIVMMYLKADSWYLARHPLHLVGDAKTFKGHDNAGVGPGRAFAETLRSQNQKVAIGLVPCTAEARQPSCDEPTAPSVNRQSRPHRVRRCPRIEIVHR